MATTTAQESGSDPVFIVMRDYGRRGQEAIVDPDYTRSNIISLIASGEWDCVVYVREMRADGTWSDITADIAAEIYEQSEDRRFSWDLLNFLQTHDAAPIGMMAAE